MAKQSGKRVGFWQRAAKSEVAALEALNAEFNRHEEAMRKLIMRLRVELPRRKKANRE